MHNPRSTIFNDLFLKVSMSSGLRAHQHHPQAGSVEQPIRPLTGRAFGTLDSGEKKSMLSFGRLRHVCCSTSDKKQYPTLHRRFAISTLSFPLVTTAGLAQEAHAGAPCVCTSCGPLKRLFAYSMATTMDEYEQTIHPVKQMLFQQVYSDTSADVDADAVRILEVGCGTGPNLQYYRPEKTILTALDPNPYMEPYFRENLKSSNNPAWTDNNVTWLEGTAEFLPFKDGSFDAVVCILVLCSVRDVDLAIAEARRVLRPGGKFLFIEHVAAGEGLIQVGQLIFDPLQQALNDGCHLRRNPLPCIQSIGGFRDIKSWTFQVEGMGLIAPHVAGIAQKV